MPYPCLYIEPDIWHPGSVGEQYLKRPIVLGRSSTHEHCKFARQKNLLASKQKQTLNTLGVCLVPPRKHIKVKRNLANLKY